MRPLTLATLVYLVTTPSAVAAQNFDFAAAIGLATADTGASICLTIHRADLAVGTPLLLLDVTGNDKPLNARSGVRRGAPCPRDMATGDEASYETTLAPGAQLQRGGVYFAVVTPPAGPVESGPVTRLDVDGDGAIEEFRTCASSEGLHLTVWPGAEMTGTRLWHRYFYLGYDVEPDCSDAEVAGR
ncbi:MAG: hypothetical protein JSW43_00805 [Gemmatimonadota bacterium]|nr:MAG: hypothetical protein JSW43_00805 [Gemmatimonadota bacterium]